MQGEIPIYEPGLGEIVRTNVEQGRLSFGTALSEAVAVADVVFIAVGTPSRRGDGHAGLSYVYEAAREIAAALRGFTVVITKSTVPVGTGDEVERIIRHLRPGNDVAVVSNPEFLREGAAIHDFKHPDRIVVGTDDERAKKVSPKSIVRSISTRRPILFTQRRTAELIKYAANAFLATKITFINEIADLCERVGADVQEVARGIGLDNRIGPKFLHAGPGFGGSCFPKDVRALIKTARDHDVPMRILQAVEIVNETRKRAMARKVSAAFAGVLRGKTVAVLGLTFKPNTDDMREAPSIPLITALQDMGAKCVPTIPSPWSSQSGSERRDLLPRALRLRGRGRCRGDRYRMGAVSGPRSRPHQRFDDLPRDRRSAQCLSAGGHEEARFCLYLRRPRIQLSARQCLYSLRSGKHSRAAISKAEVWDRYNLSQHHRP
jgi:UDPglucose 6-dehydrogenase